MSSGRARLLIGKSSGTGRTGRRWRERRCTSSAAAVVEAVGRAMARVVEVEAAAVVAVIYVGEGVVMVTRR